MERYSSLYDYSKDQIDNGDTSGSYQEIWFNVDSGRSEKFVVEWTVDENGTVNHYFWLEPVIYQGQ